jgi:hypothetical protein
VIPSLNLIGYSCEEFFYLNGNKFFDLRVSVFSLLIFFYLFYFILY